MKKSRISEHQIIKILKEVDAGRSAKDVCREYGSAMPRITSGQREFVAKNNINNKYSILRCKNFCGRENFTLLRCLLIPNYSVIKKRTIGWIGY